MWSGTEETARNFIEFFSGNSMTLKFTFPFDTYKIHFLDVTLIGNPGSGVIIAPY